MKQNKLLQKYIDQILYNFPMKYTAGILLLAICMLPISSMSIASAQSTGDQIGDTLAGALKGLGEGLEPLGGEDDESISNNSYIPKYNISSTSTTYLKDGKIVNGETTYKVDYSLLEYSDNWPYEKLHVDKVSATENSNVRVTDSEVVTDIVLKIPSKDNPNSYDIDASGGTFKIINVEMLGNGLNKYNLKFPIEGGCCIFSPALTETSPTTAEFKMVTSYE